MHLSTSMSWRWCGRRHISVFPKSKSALLLSRSTSKYSEYEVDPVRGYSPSLAPGVGGNAPGIGPPEYEGCASPFHAEFGRPVAVPAPSCLVAVAGLKPRAGVVPPSGDLGFSACVGEPEKVSPRGVRGCGLARPLAGRPGLMPVTDFWPPAALKRSSVARRRASRASSSEVWDETFCFLKELVMNVGRRGKSWVCGARTSRRQQRQGLQGSYRF